MRPVLGLLPALALLAAPGCNTTAGFGRDMEAAGVAIQREAVQARRPEPRPSAIEARPLPPVP